MPESVANSGFAYRAFISYSHADRQWADWLHKALETYRVPSRLVGKQTETGAIPRRLHPIFRDRDELPSAADLGRKVNEALAQSQNLIVICSPASARSRWVNEEVLAYKRLSRGERIFCLIVGGEPDASDLPGREAEECFCPALRFATNAAGQPTAERSEPIAADARPGKDGKPNAKLKLIAGMLDVGFDQLKQREQQRRVRRMTAIAALAVTVMLVTSVLAVYALISRHQAVIAQRQAVVAQQAAERRQKQAESLVGFMLGDLNDKLAQVQRLDIMQAVDDKAMAYFESLPSTDVTDEALQQRAKALEKIGSVREDLGNLEGALETYRASAAISSKLAASAPTDVARQVAYSRTLSFIGLIHYKQGKLSDAQHEWETARGTLQPSLRLASGNLSPLQLLAFLDNDIGHVLEARGQPEAAETAYREFLVLARKLVALKPDSTDYESQLGGAHNNLGKLALQRGDLATAIAEYRADDAIETWLSVRDPKDNSQRENVLRVRAILGRTLALTGEVQIAIRDLQQAVDIANAISKIDPNETNSKEYLALYGSQLARLQRVNGNLADAKALTARSNSIFTTLIRKDPSNAGWQSESAEALVEQSAESLADGKPNAARVQVKTALAVLEPLLAKQPGDRNIVLAMVAARLLLAEATVDPRISASLLGETLKTIQAQRNGRADPGLAALQTETLLAMNREADAKSLLKDLWKGGYRDPALLVLLQRKHVEYPTNSAFSRRLAAVMQADPIDAPQLRSAMPVSSATNHGNASPKEGNGH